MQGVVKSYDPSTGIGVVMSDTDLSDIDLAADALDGSIMPAVISPTPGGLTYWHILDLIAGVSQRGRIAGMDLIEFGPERDHANQSAAYLASRILVFTAGTIARTV